MTWKNDADTAELQILATFDHKPEWHQAKPPKAVRTLEGYKRNFGGTETELANAYGVSGCEIIVNASKGFTTPPEKFDRIHVHGEVYTVDKVAEQAGFNGSTLIYRLYCKGK